MRSPVRLPARRAPRGAVAVTAGVRRRPTETGDKGYVDGTGIITRLDADERKKPGEVSGETLDGQAGLARRLRRQGRRAQRLGLVVRRRAARRRRPSPRPRASSRTTTSSSSGSTPRTPAATTASPSSVASTSPTPRFYDPSGRTLLAFHGTLPPERDPEHRGHRRARAGSPPASWVRCRAGRTLVDLVEDVRIVTPVREPARPRRLVPRAGLRRVARARRPGRGGRRPGLVLLAVRGAAAAGLPLLRDRALRRRPRRRATARPDARRARCSSCSASPSCFVSFGALIGARRRLAVRRTSARSRRARRADDPARPGLPGRGAVAAARLAGPPGAGRRAGRRAAARRAVRARLDALHRPDADRGAGAGAQRGAAPAGARCSASSTASASGCRSSWPRSPTAGCSARSRWVRRHQQWVTAIGGADAGRRRAAARHRLVG